MATWLKYNTAVEIKLGPFVSSADGFTLLTALTITQADVRLAKNEGDWAQKSETTAAVHEENGWYRVLLNATDTQTKGILIVAVNETGALPVWREFMVVSTNTYQSLVISPETLGGTYLQVDVVAENGGAVAVPPTAAAIADAVWLADSLTYPFGGLTMGGIVKSTPYMVWEEGMADHITADTTGWYLDNVTDTVEAISLGSSTVTLSGGSLVDVADAVWDEPHADHMTIGSVGKALDDAMSWPAASTIAVASAAAVWDEAANIHTAMGSFGAIVNDVHFYTPLTIADAVWDETIDPHATSGSAAEALTFARDTLIDFNDNGVLIENSGSNRATIAAGVWNEDATAHQTVGTFGQTVGDISGGGFGLSIFDQVESIFNWLQSYQLTPNNIASYVWNKDATGHQTPGTFGQTLGDSASDGSVHAYVSGFIPAMITALPTELFDTSGSLETGMTLRGAFRVMYSALAGKISGAGTSTEIFRNVADTKNRITSSVDASGNRTSVTTDAT